MIEHIIRKHPWGFGWEVIKKVPKSPVPQNEWSDLFVRTIVFHSSSQEQCNEVCKNLNEGGSIEGNAPFTNFESQILVHDGSYFIVSSPNDVNMASKSIFEWKSGEYSWMLNDFEPIEELGFTEIDIENLPDSLKNDAIEKIKDHQSKIKERKQELYLLDLLKAGLAGNVIACRRFLEEVSPFILEVPTKYLKNN